MSQFKEHLQSILTWTPKAEETEEEADRRNSRESLIGTAFSIVLGGGLAVLLIVLLA